MTEHEGYQVPPERWNVPTRYGYHHAVQSVSSVASPLLAGFSVTMLVLVVQGPRYLRWPELALCLLVFSAIGFISSLQFGIWARSYVATPNEIMQWWPEAAEGSAILSRLMYEQSSDHDRHLKLASWTMLSFNLSVPILFGALTAALVPSAPIPPARWVAIIIMGLATATELGWFVHNYSSRARKLLPWRISHGE